MRALSKSRVGVAAKRRDYAYGAHALAARGARRLQLRFYLSPANRRRIRKNRLFGTSDAAHSRDSASVSNAFAAARVLCRRSASRTVHPQAFREPADKKRNLLCAPDRRAVF